MNSVPPLTTSMAPRRSAVAPVKAPRSWPNSSLSIRLLDTAPQSNTTKGPPRRMLAWWMARAAALLPVPVSPNRSTVASVGAIFSSSANTSRVRGFWLTSSPKLWLSDGATVTAVDTG